MLARFNLKRPKMGCAEKRIVDGAILLLLTTYVINGKAQELCEEEILFDIGAEPADTAILKFAQQAGISVLFPSSEYSSITVNRLTGKYCLEVGLQILLENTPIEAFLDDSSQLVIQIINEAGQEPVSVAEEDNEDLDTGSTLNFIDTVISAFFPGSDVPVNQNTRNGSLPQEISVTGSRIRTTSGFSTATPVTSMTTDQLSDLEPGNTISGQLDALPQFFNTQTTQLFDGETLHGRAGASSINIRNLGSNRTLVLLDGSRIVPTDKRGTINVDSLPTALIRSVDVVTGGASAAYGADAVGGVVNFVLDREYEGLNISTGFGQHETGVGRQWQLEITGGESFIDDRLHIVGSMQSREIEQIKSDWKRLGNYQFWGHITNPAWLDGDHSVPQRLTRPWVTDTRISPTGKIFGTGTELDDYKFSTDGSYITPFVKSEGYCSGRLLRGCVNTQSGGPEADINARAHNFEWGPAGNEVIVRSFFAGLQYDVTDRLTVTLDATAGRSESNTRGIGTFNFSNVWYGSIAIDNAFLPEEVRQIMIDNDLEEIKISKDGAFDNTSEIGGNQEDINVFTQVQTVMGFDYQIPGVEWNLIGKWQQGESKRNSQGIERIRQDRAFLGMDAVREPGTGAIVCRVQLYQPTEEQLAASVEGQFSSRPVDPFINNSGTSVQSGNFAGDAASSNARPLPAPIGLDNTIRDCVPYNVLGSGNMSPEAIDYVGTVRIQHAYVKQDFAELLLTGELHEGWGNGAVSFAAGLTWRDQWFYDSAGPLDEFGPAQNVPELGIRGIPPGTYGGSPNLHLFSLVPNVGGDLNVWEWFSELNVPLWEGSFIESQDQRLGLSIGFRESDYSRSGKQDSWKVGIEFQILNDLRLRYTRSQDVREATFNELFDAQGGGVTVNDPRFNGARYTFTLVSGGDPDLQPEEAQSVVAGFVYQPSLGPWSEGLQLSVDWYQVNIDGAIGALGGQRIVNECELNQVQELCDQIIRNEEGQLTRVLNPFLNVARAKVEGVDVEMVYQFEPDFFTGEIESLDLRMLGGYIFERSDAPFKGELFDFSGSRETPKLTGLLTGAYTTGPYTFQLQGQHIDSVNINPRWIEGMDVDDNTVPSSTWWNMRIGYDSMINNGDQWSVNLNVQNVFDRSPPVVPNINQQMIDNYYDIYGRRYNLSMNYSF